MLGLQKNCSQEEIKKAYIKMAKEVSDGGEEVSRGNQEGLHKDGQGG